MAAIIAELKVQETAYLEGGSVVKRQKARHFFGDTSAVGINVVVDISAQKKQGSRTAEIVSDTQDLIVVRYLKTNFRESFTRADFTAGHVRFFPQDDKTNGKSQRRHN